MTYKFKETDGHTNLDIFENMMGDITISVSRYYKWYSKVIGWVTGRKGDTLVHVNGKYFDGNDPVEIASNLLHETAHMKGYHHSSAKSWSSVPYSMNQILGRVADAYKLG